MKILRKQSARIGLFVGDVAVLAASLYVTLAIRFVSIPTIATLSTHFQAFGWLFLFWAAVFFVAGLYDREILLFPKTLPQRIFRAQVANSVLAVLFFYTIPYFAITPKTILFIFVAVSFVLILLWRNLGVRFVTNWVSSSRLPQMVVVASGAPARQLSEKIRDNPRRGVALAEYLDPDNYTARKLREKIADLAAGGTDYITVDTGDPDVRKVLPELYDLLYSGVQLYEFNRVYEELFSRVPLPQIRHRWFIEHLSVSPHMAYDLLKRSMDVVVAGVLILLSLPFLPFVALAIWLEDGGPIFFTQKRVGEAGKIITVTKLRSMTTGEEDNITSVGWFLRRTRIDELPQLWSVFTGDLSLIGPRPEKPDLAKQYQQEIPYYNARHLIRPGISGWAQLKHSNPPKYGVDVARTKGKLAYDLYYVKHRSVLLDVKIALRTIQVMLSQSGE